VIQPDPTEAGAYRLLGHGVTITNRIPDTTATPATGRAALVDMSQVAVARDLAPSVKVLDQTFAGTDEMALRVVARYDAAPLNPEAVVKLTGITLPA
jgi:HK97 family phage major capsid protein